MINDPSWGPWKWGEPNDYGWASVRLLAGNFLFADRHPWAKYWALCEKSVGKFERVKKCSQYFGKSDVLLCTGERFLIYELN